MGIFNRKQEASTPNRGDEKNSETAGPDDQSLQHHPGTEVQHTDDVSAEEVEKPKVTLIAVTTGTCAAIGGGIFGYESGEVGGFMAMPDYLARFGQNNGISAVRQGTIVGLLPIGCLVGCFITGPLADKIGRKWTIFSFSIVYMVGVIVEISSEYNWVQYAIGRLVAGFGVGALSTVVPMYQSEIIPLNIRRVVVASYQLMITTCMWVAYMINWKTVAVYDNSAQWRITVGVSFLWPLILCGGIIFLPESPRYLFRNGKEKEARAIFARMAGVSINHPSINKEIEEIEERRRDEIAAGQARWTGIFTDPGMLHRTLLGGLLMVAQQLTGANFFFYYGTTIFKSTGISNSYVTNIILGSVHLGATFVGMYLIKKYSIRKSLLIGSVGMASCFLIFTFVGEFMLDASDPQSTPEAGQIMIAFTCIFVLLYSSSWGPMIWATISEMYPTQYRSRCMAIATICNWTWNFLISFFTKFITNDIHYYYGLIFACSCFVAFFLVLFFLLDTKGRSLEEIDIMYSTGVSPFHSLSWSYEDYKHQKAEGKLAAAGGVFETSDAEVKSKDEV